MGLFDKIKDLFTDEEDDEENEFDDSVKIKEIKKEEKKEEKKEKTENKLPTFMREKIEEEEKFKLDEDKKEEKRENSITSRLDSRINNNVYTEDTVEIPSEVQKSFKFPVSFTDEDYSPSIPSRSEKKYDINKLPVEEVIEEKHVDVTDKFNLERPKEEKKEKKVAELYKGSEKKEEHKFKSTPIISPIYGILDKNYSKDQIKEADQDSYELKRSSVSKSIDFESVRKKAYGNLSDDIKENLMCENCELLKEAKEEKLKEQKKKEKDNKDNIVNNYIEENKKVEDITFGDATENYYDFGLEYEKQKETIEVPNRSKKEEVKIKEPKLNEIKEESKKEVKIVNSKENKPKKEIPPVKSSINLLSALKKSMGEEVKEEQQEEIKQPETKNQNKKDLELTDDLFNLIDSMYDERND